ncbi:MAG: hypothetical protein Q7T36_15160 [Fluviicoccus sp.]|uniref:DUF6160 family protein n=1 Tax=Fluviicoccus sp. TaxID=2003552 RepID=UPI00272673A3|nr:DUF6160 family protein [Fluviicoccus sp.]MDO8331803.1 hypothetical protein [Fluviicoccus sp.]
MKAFQKLALVSAIALTSTAFAMEVADDETLAAATGQDGITIAIAPGTRTGAQLTGLGVNLLDAGVDLDLAINGGNADGVYKGLSITQTVIHDDDGLNTLGLSRAGAIVMGDGTAADATVIFADNQTPIIVKIDAIGDNSAAAGNTAMLQVGIETPTLVIKTSDIYVAASNANADETVSGLDHNGDGDILDVETNGSSNSDSIRIMNGLTLKVGASGAGNNLMTIQLGNEAQTLFGGAASAVNPEVMIKLTATLTGGLVISNLELLDQDAVAGPGLGGIRAASMAINNAGSGVGGNLDVVAGVNVGDGSAATNPNGLVITLGQLGTALGGADITLNNVQLGSAAAPDLGDVQMLGLNLAGASLIISGH